jgi:crotonobetainyl-CoA:carnitine CoA-transferase CaiB-like acyl-CoA transferase
VVIENFRPGTMERLGLGYEACLQLNPHLVYCSISGFGNGEGAARPGYDFIVQAAGGLMSITGEAGRQPMKVGVALVDILVGLHATIGTLAALRGVSQGGPGRHVEVNLFSSLLSSLANQGSAFAAAGVVPERLGNFHPSIAPYELFEAADRPVAVACGNDRQFEGLCKVLDRTDLLGDERFATNRSRVAHRMVLHDELASAFRTRGSETLVDELSQAGVPAGPVNDLAEAFALAESLGLEPVQYVDGPDGRIPQVSSPLRIDGRPLDLAGAPPALGEHTDEVLAWLATSREPDA